METIYTILEELKERAPDGHLLYRVQCKKCGKIFVHKKFTIDTACTCRHFRTGVTNRRIAEILKSMINRCTNPQDKAYRYYGAKGIQVCDEWKSDAAAFEQWSLSHGYTDDLTIDRIDPTQNYCPENCRWISLVDNSKYKSTTNLITVDGITRTGKDWAKIIKTGVNRINRYYRLYGEEYTVRYIQEQLHIGE